jgi:hypothetical protein
MGVSGWGGGGCASAGAVLMGHFNAEFAESTEGTQTTRCELRIAGEMRLREQEGSFKTCRAEQRHYGRLVFIVNRLLIITLFCWR